MEDNLTQTIEAMNSIEDERTQPLADLLTYGMDLAVANITAVGYTLPPSYVQSTTDEFMRIWGAASTSSYSLVSSSLTKNISVKNVGEQILRDFSETFGANRISSVVSTTNSLVIDKVRRGMARGRTVDELLRQITNESPQISLARARVIVGNEAHTSSQYTSQRVAEASLKLLRKKWNSIRDDNVRRFGLLGRQDEFNHLVMHGQTRPLLDTFSVPTRSGGFENVLFPGDPNGSAGNTIGCRCLQTYEEAI